MSKAEAEVSAPMFAVPPTEDDLAFVAANDFDTLRSMVAKYDDIIAEYADSTLPEAKVFLFASRAYLQGVAPATAANTACFSPYARELRRKTYRIGGRCDETTCVLAIFICLQVAILPKKCVYVHALQRLRCRA